MCIIMQLVCVSMKYAILMNLRMRSILTIFLFAKIFMNIYRIRMNLLRNKGSLPNKKMDYGVRQTVCSLPYIYNFKKEKKARLRNYITTTLDFLFYWKFWIADGVHRESADRIYIFLFEWNAWNVLERCWGVGLSFNRHFSNGVTVVLKVRRVRPRHHRPPRNLSDKTMPWKYFSRSYNNGYHDFSFSTRT